MKKPHVSLTPIALAAVTLNVLAVVADVMRFLFTTQCSFLVTASAPVQLAVGAPAKNVAVIEVTAPVPPAWEVTTLLVLGVTLKYPLFVGEPHTPIGRNTLFFSTIFSVVRGETTLVLLQRLVPMFVHAVTEVSPEIIGFAPVPKAPIFIEAADVPDLFITIPIPLPVSPRLTSIESPATKEVNIALNLVIVFHGVAGFCACAMLLASSPVAKEK